MSSPEPLSGPGVEALVRRVIDVVNAARPMPLSTSVMISREEVVELLEHALEELPGECREARWLLKERDDVIGRAHSEAETILAESRARIAQMVQKTEMVRIAEQRARQIVEESEATARRRQHEVDDYCDQKLAQFDAALENIHQTVNGARGKLHLAQPDSSSTQASTGASAIEQTEEIVSTFFDQDES
jgi:hypothetical protein